MTFSIRILYVKYTTSILNVKKQHLFEIEIFCNIILINHLWSI